jgi:hypothetical protein
LLLLAAVAVVVMSVVAVGLAVFYLRHHLRFLPVLRTQLLLALVVQVDQVKSVLTVLMAVILLLRL